MPDDDVSVFNIMFYSNGTHVPSLNRFIRQTHKMATSFDPSVFRVFVYWTQ